MNRTFLLALLTLTFYGCGDEGGITSGEPHPNAVSPVASCTMSAGGTNVCVDYAGNLADLAALEQICDSTGTWSETAFCSPTDSCGSCTVSGSIASTTYYYDGSGDEGMSETICGNGMGVWTDVTDKTCN